MKIKGDYLNSLLPKDKQNKATTKSNFAELLQQEIKAENKHTSSEKVSPLTSLNLNLDNLRLNFMQELDNLFNLWEDYSQKLGDSQSSLKEVYTLLSNLKNKLENLKKNPSYSSQSPEVKNILQELEVLTTTEEIKLNRGDYL